VNGRRNPALGRQRATTLLTCLLLSTVSALAAGEGEAPGQPRLITSTPSTLVSAPSAGEVGAPAEPRILSPTPSTFETLSRFTELLDTLQKKYVQPSRVNAEWYTTAGLRAFVRSIDPDADLLTPEEAASTDDHNADASDIGVAFVTRGGIPQLFARTTARRPNVPAYWPEIRSSRSTIRPRSWRAARKWNGFSEAPRTPK